MTVIMATMKRLVAMILISAANTSAFAIRDGHKLEDHIDKYSGDRIVVLSGVPSQACAGDKSLVFGGDVVSLEFTLTEVKDGGKKYSLITRVVTDNPILLTADETMDVLADSTPIKLHVTSPGHTEPFKLDPFSQALLGSPRRQGLVYEVTTFDLDATAVDLLSQSSLMQFRTNGPTKRERCVPRKNLQSLQEFKLIISAPKK